MESKFKILIVDDEVPVCRSVASALEGCGYAVDTALSGEEGLRKDRETDPDVIIVDLMMPGLSGMDLLKAVRDRRSNVAVVMITGYPSVKSAVQAVKFGAFDYLPKPFTPKELRSIVTRALERKRFDSVERIAVPSDLYRIPENSWARIQDDGLVRVGVDHALLRSIRDIASVELPRAGEIRRQGEVFVRITGSDRQIYRAWAPVTGTIVKTNERLERDPSALARDPYGEGWVLLLKPVHIDRDLENLVASSSGPEGG